KNKKPKTHMGIENKTIIIGRNERETEKYGEKGTAHLGKIVMSSGENPVLGRKVLMDIAKPHLTLICGKRGGGKSHTMAVILEEMAKQPIEIKTRMSTIVIDTVGIFWSMKYPAKTNYNEISEWELEPQSTDLRVLVPENQVEFYKNQNIPIEGAFTIKTSELEAQDWMALFKVSWKDPEGILITRIIEETKQKLGTRYSIQDIITAIKKDEESEKNTKEAVIGRFETAKTLNLFEKEGYRIKEIAKPGQITIIDVSTYRQTTESEGTRDTIVSLIGKRLFEERMKYRKEEEIRLIKGQTRSSELPLIWLFIDEAHMFMPKDQESTALKTLLEWVRVGRQPGLSLVLATQRPDKLHPDCISQCDIFISHRMTSQLDIEAVSQLRPSYIQTDFGKYYQEMPRSKGYAIILDDETEKVMLTKIRPRLSWDAGTTATAFRE
ncbi:MAG: ATP-binding protein, partial [Candidatus Diapherotrites archaeon]